MNKIKPHLLIIDDEDSMLKTYNSILKKDFELTLSNSPLKALEMIPRETFSLVLLDMKMPEMDGIEVLGKIKEIDNKLEVIIVSASNDIKPAINAIKLGAYDYIAKPFEIEELRTVIGKALEKRSLIMENLCLKEALKENASNYNIIGQSPAMKKVFGMIAKVAPLDSTVLITGQSGTGKEIVAHTIHTNSKRANKPLITINCAALPESLIESELFGHERGAFTGAGERKLGKFELAEDGTIFLDEIGCMKPGMQTRLLRVLQNNIIDRVGGSKPIEIDVRVIAATNLDLKDAIEKGEFREDLYYRLNVISIDLPPLCERMEDIPLFLQYFLEKYNKEFNKNINGFNKDTENMLKKYSWPGNVRELQNLVERLVALSDDNSNITPENLPLENNSRNLIKKGLKEALMDFESRYIKNALAEANGNQTKAAEILSVHRTTLISKMKELNISGH